MYLSFASQKRKKKMQRKRDEGKRINRGGQRRKERIMNE